MFINRPSDRVQDAARAHVSEPITTVVPVSWGFGFSTMGIFAFVFAYILMGTLVGSLVPTWVLAVIMCTPMALLLLQTRRGKLGQGMLAMTPSSGPERAVPEREVVVLKAKRMSALTPSGDVHRSYDGPTPVELVEQRRWWQGLRCRVGDHLYYINPNYDDEARRALLRVST